MTETNDNAQDSSGTPRWLFYLLGVGILLVLVGIVVFASTSVSSGRGSAGVVIFIGPIPVVFGAGPDAGILILVGVLIAATMFALVFLRRRCIN